MPYRAGDVVWGPDPYHFDDPELDGLGGRPWVVISTPRFPAQGRAYICCALTSSNRRDPSLMLLLPGDWEVGGVPKPSRIDLLTVMVVTDSWTSLHIGRLDPAKVARVQTVVRGYFGT